MADWVLIGVTVVLTLATIVLSLFTAGLYYQTKRANRPHVSVSLEHTNEMGACALSIENHGPGVAFKIKAKLEQEYKSGEELALLRDDPSLTIAFLKPGKARNIRIPGARNLGPEANRARVEYFDVFGDKMSGEFDLKISALMAHDPIAAQSEILGGYIYNAVNAIREPLSALPNEIKELRREVESASRSFRFRN